VRVITWDVEIEIPVSEHREGWAGAKRGECGISSVALYDTFTERFHLYDDITIVKCMEHLNSADLLVGWNSLDFDLPCITGFSGIRLEPPHYDMLHEVWEAGAKREKGVWRLGATCLRTIGLDKSGTGEAAPELAQAGRYAELFDYNINDVHLTRRLANYVHEHGHLIGPSGKPLAIRSPGAPC
jgi:DEAD/DEAH box helicase domain-containing protein